MKTTKKFIAALLAVTLVFVLFSCDDAPHVHTFSEDWSSDDTYHWHKATCEHTEEVSGRAEHTFGEWVEDKAATIKEKGKKHRICTVCNYRQDAEIDILDHTCTASSTYGYGENKHWFKCTNPLCDKHIQEADHTFNIGSQSEDGKVTMSCVCGASIVVENAVLVADATSLTSAVKEDKTIILKNDITLENTIDITKDVTIDLNGKTISSTKRVFLVKAGTLTLDNGTVKADIADDAGSSAIRVSAEADSITRTTQEDKSTDGKTAYPGKEETHDPDAAVVLKKDAKIVAPKSYGITAFGSKGTADAKRYITLDIYGTIESGNPCIGGSGTKACNNTVVTMNVYDGAVLTATNDLTVERSKNNDKVAVYQPNPGTLNIEGGTITSKNGSAVEVRAGYAYITGGKLVSEATAYSAEANGNGPTVIGAAVAVSQHTTGQPIQVVITGGTLESSTGKKLAVESLQGASNNDHVFVGADINVVDNSLKIGKDFKGGLYVTDKDSQKEVYYAGNSSEAFAEIANYVPKVILLDDITLDSAVKIGSKDKKQTTLTIDMNGKTISGNTRNSFNSSLFDICNAKVTFDGTGTLQDTGKWFGEIMVRGSATDVEEYTVVTVNKGITCKDGQAVWVDRNSESNYADNYGVKVYFYGTADLKGINDYAFYIQGNNNKKSEHAPVFNIEGATITAGDNTSGLGIYAAGYGTWNIKDTTITGFASAIEIRAGVLNIESGTYTSTATSFSCNANNNGITTTGAAIAVSQHTTALPVSVNISGGEFSGFHAMSVQNPQKTNNSKDVVVTVTGGNFTAKENNDVVKVDTSYFKISDNPKYSQSASFTVKATTETN